MTSSDKLSSSVVGRAKDADERLAALSSLLSRLDEAAQVDGLSRNAHQDSHQSLLVKRRLGVASSLFAALRAKHPPTANHCLRVALGVSAWASAKKISSEEQDDCEVAALLHDIGKVGVSDHILSKPGKLMGEELLEMERQRHIGAEILSACCASTGILEIVIHASAWFDGSKHGFNRKGEEVPLGSRMIAIVDAFDAMTTDHVYRPALPVERAVAELFENSGTQFDPVLVREFCELSSRGPAQRNVQVTRRWLHDLTPAASDSLWTLRQTQITDRSSPQDSGFHEHLIDTLCDGVMFANGQLQITRWNRAAERITGISAAGLLGKQWCPGILRLRDERGQVVADADCPVVQVLQSGVPTIRRYIVCSRGENRLSVDMHLTPVIGSDGLPQGVTMVLHDASSQISLEERVRSLHEKATRDALTKAANRAELNRVLPEFMETHHRERLPCSLIMCDIDHFKKINDVHGHHAGDEALTVFSSLLLRSSRAGDLVARYGGEEFVVLCADCDNVTATRRAEEIRRRVAETPMPSLANNCITASFGVTEVQGGDTPETFLRRADRALLQAKGAGRNLVVQLGTGIAPEAKAVPSQGWFTWFGGGEAEVLLEASLVTVVPLKVTTEKLRGFVADQHSEIVSIEGDRVTLSIDGQQSPLMRRTTDRAVPFIMELTFDEQQRPVEGRPNATALCTLMHVVIRPKRQRDRRRRDGVERARQLLISLKSYLMASEDEGNTAGPETKPESDGILDRSKQILSHWLRK